VAFLLVLATCTCVLVMHLIAIQSTIVIIYRLFGWWLNLPSRFDLELQLHNVFLGIIDVCLRHFQL
jgi:hypothetical protein